MKKLMVVIIAMRMSCFAIAQDWPAVAHVKISSIGDLHCKSTQHIEGDGKSEAGNRCVDDVEPAACGKFQHKVFSDAQCSDKLYLNSDGSFRDACFVPFCADDMHEVTEREWQSIVQSIDLLTKLNDIHSARLKMLEKPSHARTK